MIKKNNYVLDDKRIYIILIGEYLTKLKNLEQEYLQYLNSNENESKNNILDKIKINLKFLNYLFKEKTTKPYINIKLPIILSDSDINSNIGEKNIFEIILDDFKINWLKNNLIKSWEENGGIIPTDTPQFYLDKYKKVLFLSELDKDFKNINKKIIKEYKYKFYNLLKKEYKIKLNTFLIYLLLKNSKKKLSEISEISDIFNIAEKIIGYFIEGVDLDLLEEKNILELLGIVGKYLDEKKKINSSEICIYFEILGKNKYLSKDEKLNKINQLKKKYFIDKLNELIFSGEYLENPDRFIQISNMLNELNYEFNSKQRKKINLLKLYFDKSHYTFEYNIWYPLFTVKTLGLLKEKILCGFNNLENKIKKIYPFYKISTNFFCLNKNKISGKLVYTRQKDIFRTINLYGAIILVVGIINRRLFDTNQHYRIIIKGGKAYQMILSNIESKTDFETKEFLNNDSNDVDLIINPIDLDQYDEEKCKNFTLNIINLIKWIFNIDENIYKVDNFVSSIEGQTYKTLLKISHKIQESDDLYFESSYTAIADFDYSKIDNLFYSNLVKDDKYLDEFGEFGKLIYWHQNYDDYLFEKIFYLNYYNNEYNRLKQLFRSKKYIPTQKDYEKFKNDQRFIDKISFQLNQIIKIKQKQIMNKLNCDTLDQDIILAIKVYLLNLTSVYKSKIKMSNIFKYLNI